MLAVLKIMILVEVGTLILIWFYLHFTLYFCLLYLWGSLLIECVRFTENISHNEN